MTLTKSRSKNSVSLYVTKSVRENGKKTSRVVEKLGTVAELEKKLVGQDPIAWAEAYVRELTIKEREGRREISVKYVPNEIIDKDKRQLFSVGYLFLQKLYYEMGIDKICKAIERTHDFTFDLSAVLSRLVYGRIIFPSSKKATYEQSDRFIEPPCFEIQHVYRSLEVLAKESDFIQAELYKNSTRITERKTGILYYDCTNYFFEIEQEEGIKRYGHSKEHRPNPLVQMGLLMDGDGFPLAFSINKGNTNEQTTLKPLEKRILSDFKLSRFVVCTDAGLSSAENKQYNDMGERAFVTTQSLRKLKKYLREWALDPRGWHLPGDDTPYDISQIDEERHQSSTFFKERWIAENGLEQKLIVTYSLKYRHYQRTIRAGQVQRAAKLVASGSTRLKRVNQNDYRRFISKTSVTDDGRVAKRELYGIDETVIAAEEIFDGFYAVCTNLEDEPPAIIRINQRRWEIEECFRIMKSELRARPVYLQRDDRIEAHFITCFISLLIYRLLEKRLNGHFTCSQIIQQLREMVMLEVPREGYIPAYTRTDFTDALHEAFAFRTDYRIITSSQMKKIIKATKS